MINLLKWISFARSRLDAIESTSCIPGRCVVARHASHCPQMHALSFETPQLWPLHARPSTAVAAACWPRLIAALPLREAFKNCPWCSGVARFLCKNIPLMTIRKLQEGRTPNLVIRSQCYPLTRVWLYSQLHATQNTVTSFLLLKAKSMSQ